MGEKPDVDDTKPETGRRECSDEWGHTTWVPDGELGVGHTGESR